MTDETLRIEAAVTHAPLERRSVITLVLTGGELDQRTEAARQIIEHAGAGAAGSDAASPQQEGLAGVFSVLLAPAAPQQVQAAEAPRSSPGSVYDEPFILAPIG